MAILTILTPVAENYKSIRVRAKTLAEASHIGATFEHVSSTAQLGQLLQTLHGKPVCLCCEITSSNSDSAEAIRDYLKDVWKDTDDWLRQRPIIVMSEYQDIVRDLKKIERSHPREHSVIILKLPSVGTNRWSDVRDALQDGMENA